MSVCIFINVKKFYLFLTFLSLIYLSFSLRLLWWNLTILLMASPSIVWSSVTSSSMTSWSASLVFSKIKISEILRKNNLKVKFMRPVRRGLELSDRKGVLGRVGAGRHQGGHGCVIGYRITNLKKWNLFNKMPEKFGKNGILLP